MSQPPSEEESSRPLADADTDEASGGGGHDGTGMNWPTMLAFGAIGLLVVLIVILHLTGVVGPTGHR